MRNLDLNQGASRAKRAERLWFNIPASASLRILSQERPLCVSLDTSNSVYAEPGFEPDESQPAQRSEQDRLGSVHNPSQRISPNSIPRATALRVARYVEFGVCGTQISTRRVTALAATYRLGIGSQISGNRVRRDRRSEQPPIRTRARPPALGGRPGGRPRRRRAVRGRPDTPRTRSSRVSHRTRRGRG